MKINITIIKIIVKRIINLLKCINSQLESERERERERERALFI